MIRDEFDDVVGYVPGEPASYTLPIDFISLFYGYMDGYSFCSHTYDLVIEPAVRPLWMAVNDNTIVVRSSTSFDPEDSITVTVKVMKDGNRLVTDRFLKARLVCAEQNFLCERMLEIPAVTDPYYVQLEGSNIPLKSYEDSWYVPRNFYRLTKIEMWKNEKSTQGFKVTYTRANYEYCRDWPEELTHTFGSDDTDLSTDYISLDFDTDLSRLDLCG